LVINIISRIFSTFFMLMSNPYQVIHHTTLFLFENATRTLLPGKCQNLFTFFQADIKMSQQVKGKFTN
jgi:hypothetical protein